MNRPCNPYMIPPFPYSAVAMATGASQPANFTKVSSERELVATVLERRQKEIDHTKNNLVGYSVYVQQVPRYAFGRLH